MPTKDKLDQALKREGAIIFDVNQAHAAAISKQLDQLKTSEVDGVTCWHEGEQPSVKNTRIRVYSTGHAAFYNSEGRRFLSTDPGGEPLNEAEWVNDGTTGKAKLNRVRMQLDCGQWVGIKPGAKTFKSEIDIKGQEGWEDMNLDDLRKKAAAA